MESSLFHSLNLYATKGLTCRRSRHSLFKEYKLDLDSMSGFFVIIRAHCLLSTACASYHGFFTLRLWSILSSFCSHPHFNWYLPKAMQSSLMEYDINTFILYLCLFFHSFILSFIYLFIYSLSFCIILFRWLKLGWHSWVEKFQPNPTRS